MCKGKADIIQCYSEIKLDDGKYMKYKEIKICMRCYVKDRPAYFSEYIF